VDLALWNKHRNVMLQAYISSDTSGRCFVGIVDFVHGPTKVTTKEFKEPFLNKDIQVKEGEALTLTIQMLLTEH